LAGGVKAALCQLSYPGVKTKKPLEISLKGFALCNVLECRSTQVALRLLVYIDPIYLLHIHRCVSHGIRLAYRIIL
jgi:hypothetical protein